MPLLRQKLASVVILNDLDSIKKFYTRKEFLNRSRFWVMQSNRFQGLGTMNGDTWKLNRRFCMHTLRDFGMGKSYAMKDIVEEFQWACSQIAKAEGEPVAFYDYIVACAYNNILAIVFGRRFPYDHPARADINRLVNRWLAAVQFSLRNQYNPGFVTAIRKRVRGTEVNLARRKMEDLGLYVYDRIIEHKATAENGVNRDFVDAYLRKIQDSDDVSKPHFTGPGSCVAEVPCSNAVEYAGHTSGRPRHQPQTRTLVASVASAQAGGATFRYRVHPDNPSSLRFVFFHGSVQREIDEVIGRDRRPTWEDRLRMPFTMASVWEMDRWKTSTPLGVPREASEDAVVDDFFIPKGTVIMANFWAAHFDPKVWRDPHKFDPTRFLNEDGTLMARKPECLLPFSVGQRSCPGETLATVETFLGVTSLLQRFRVLPAGKMPFDINSPP
ncbi:cytochrome P450 2C23 [Rhipicephalus sanguineus]|uniref:cytochrome P450 2C23 n=1 Tax=Rhipicephalus sanguineus TaxID=34632 RepID=UPI0020C4E7DC|nr:cytochrome P450 2C23 [Rhipicephalus sanguineus]